MPQVSDENRGGEKYGWKSTPVETVMRYLGGGTATRVERV